MTAKQPYQNRTATVHFGATKQDYLALVQSEDRKALIAHLQPHSNPNYLRSVISLDASISAATQFMGYASVRCKAG